MPCCFVHPKKYIYRRIKGTAQSRHRAQSAVMPDSRENAALLRANGFSPFDGSASLKLYNCVAAPERFVTLPPVSLQYRAALRKPLRGNRSAGCASRSEERYETVSAPVYFHAVFARYASPRCAGKAAMKHCHRNGKFLEDA